MSSELLIGAQMRAFGQEVHILIAQQGREAVRVLDFELGVVGVETKPVCKRLGAVDLRREETIVMNALHLGGRDITAIGGNHRYARRLWHKRADDDAA